MKPHLPTAKTSDMFRPRLDEQLNMQHPLIRLAGLMDWELIEHHFAGHFTSGRGRPALPPRLVAGLGDALHAISCAAGYNLRWLLWAIARLGLGPIFLCLLAAFVSASKHASASAKPACRRLGRMLSGNTPQAACAAG